MYISHCEYPCDLVLGRYHIKVQISVDNALNHVTLGHIGLSDSASVH